tara:strand:+ start:25755 stop:26783 length:1029 start_codon:yes stop_codon:yes gene_type:complete
MNTLASMQNIEPKAENTTKVVHVCVAVIERWNAATDKKEVLIAKRPKHVHQGGLWEFPGGKVEKGEAVLNALDRELFEELDIQIKPLAGHENKCQSNYQLIQIKHAYPDKVVFLDVWCIQYFSGTPIGKEGQEVRWVDSLALYQYAFPDANQSIISACLLPNRYFITPAYTSILDAEKSLDSALSKQAELIYLRQPQLGQISYASWVEALLLRKPELSAKLVYQFAETLDEYPGAGVHLSQSRSLSLKTRPVSKKFWFAMSCHNQSEIERAVEQGADFITLSPVLPTLSHPDHADMGWEEFKYLVLNAEVPVYGLGGLSFNDESSLIATGAQGMAGISFWQT